VGSGLARPIRELAPSRRAAAFEGEREKRRRKKPAKKYARMQPFGNAERAETSARSEHPVGGGETAATRDAPDWAGAARLAADGRRPHLATFNEGLSPPARGIVHRVWQVPPLVEGQTQVLDASGLLETPIQWQRAKDAAQAVPEYPALAGKTFADLCDEGDSLDFYYTMTIAGVQENPSEGEQRRLRVVVSGFGDTRAYDFAADSRGGQAAYNINQELNDLTNPLQQLFLTPQVQGTPSVYPLLNVVATVTLVVIVRECPAAEEPRQQPRLTSSGSTGPLPQVPPQPRPPPSASGEFDPRGNQVTRALGAWACPPGFARKGGNFVVGPVVQGALAPPQGSPIPAGQRVVAETQVFGPRPQNAPPAAAETARFRPLRQTAQSPQFRPLSPGGANLVFPVPVNRQRIVPFRPVQPIAAYQVQLRSEVPSAIEQPAASPQPPIADETQEPALTGIRPDSRHLVRILDSLIPVFNTPGTTWGKARVIRELLSRFDAYSLRIGPTLIMPAQKALAITRYYKMADGTYVLQISAQDTQCGWRPFISISRMLASSSDQIFADGCDNIFSSGDISASLFDVLPPRGVSDSGVVPRVFGPAPGGPQAPITSLEPEAAMQLPGIVEEMGNSAEIGKAPERLLLPPASV
jgi:hypothetical protein